MMANLFEVLYTEGTEEHKKHVIAADEDDVRAHLTAQETAGTLEAGWKIYDVGQIESTSTVTAPTQLTKDPAQPGVWLETA